MSAGSRRGDWILVWALVAGVFFGGLAAFVSANGRSEREAVIAAAPVETHAEIVAVEQQVSGRNRLSDTISYWYIPTVEFRLKDGSLQRATLDGEHDSEQFVVGEPLAITYAANHPSIVVATERRWDYRVGVLWGWALMTMAVLATVLIAVGTHWYRRTIRPRPRRK